MNDIPAFPRPHSGTTQYAQAGMTLRDYFAAKAMQSLIARRGNFTDTTDLENEFETGENQIIADLAYTYAQAMLKARDTFNG
jgi:hypothetical protein